MAANVRTKVATGQRTGRLLGHVLRGARAEGLDVRSLFERAASAEPGSADLARLRDWARAASASAPPLPEGQIQAAEAWAAWEAALAVSPGGLATPWRYGAQIPPGESSHTLRMVATTSASVGAALRALARYSALVAQVYAFHVDDGADGGGTLRIEGFPARLGAIADLVFLTSVMVHWAGRMLGRDERSAFRLALPWGEADERLPQASLVELRWGAPAYALAIHADVWGAPVLTDDPPLNALLEQRIQGEIAWLRPTMSARIRAAFAALPAHRWTAADVARHCAVSARTMRRELQAEQQSFRGLLDAWRRSQALAWLHRDSDGELAARLGFADARALRRAFVAWTGTTPSQARSQLALRKAPRRG